MWLSVTAGGLTYWPGVLLGVSKQKRIAFYLIKRKLYPANLSPKDLTYKYQPSGKRDIDRTKRRREIQRY
jgi:hypothetical protein